MISFAINGEFLDLPPNPSVELKRFSTLFQFEGFVQDDYTFPIAFPSTPKNRRIFDFPHIVENAARLRPKWEAVLFYNGVPRLKGEIRAKSPINAKVITGNFVAGLGLIGEDIRKRKLAELIDETVTIHELEVTKSIVLIFSLSANYSLTINGREYGEDTFTALLDAINADSGADFTASGVAGVMTVTLDSIGEFLELHVETAEGSGIQVLGGSTRPLWLTEYRDAYIDFVDDHLGDARADKKVRFGTYGNLNGYGTSAKSLKRWPVVNYISSGDLRMNDFRDGAAGADGAEMDNITSLAPMLTVQAMLTAIEEVYGISISFFALNPDDVLFHPWTLDRAQKFFNEEQLILLERSFNLNQLVPDITVNDFLKALQIGFNAETAFDPEIRTLTISHRQPQIIARAYEDITLACSPPSDVQLPVQRGIRFTYEVATPDTIPDMDIRPTDYLVDEGERTISAAWGAAGMRNHTSKSDWPQDAALFTALVNMPADAKFPLRFARYVDHIDTPFIDASPFLWNGLYGLIATYWSQSMEFENSPVTIRNTWLMPRNEIFAPRWGQRWRIDRSDFLLQEFSVGLLTNQVTVSDCVFVKLPAFAEGSPTPLNLGWRVLASSFECTKDGEGMNTGEAFYRFLEQYNIDTDAVTGVTKINIDTDPDYVAPAENLVSCPVSFGGYLPGNLYITMDPALTSPDEKIVINGTEYNLRSGSGTFPYPYAMGEITDVGVIIAGIYGVYNWTVSVYVDHDKVYENTRTVGPQNAGPPGTEQINLTYRTINLSDSLFDELKVNRIIITREAI